MSDTDKYTDKKRMLARRGWHLVFSEVDEVMDTGVDIVVSDGGRIGVAAYSASRARELEGSAYRDWLHIPFDPHRMTWYEKPGDVFRPPPRPTSTTAQTIYHVILENGPEVDEAINERLADQSVDV